MENIKEVIEAVRQRKAEREGMREDYGVKGMKWGEHKAEETEVSGMKKNSATPSEKGFTRVTGHTHNGVNESLSNFYIGNHPKGYEAAAREVENAVLDAKPTEKGLGDGICKALKDLNRGRGQFEVRRENDDMIEIRSIDPWGNRSYIKVRK